MSLSINPMTRSSKSMSIQILADATPLGDRLQEESRYEVVIVLSTGHLPRRQWLFRAENLSLEAYVEKLPID